MIRHWNRHPAHRAGPEGPLADACAAGSSTAIGAVMSGLVLLVVLATKFIHGAGYAIAAMIVLFILMLGIRRHYDHVRDELAVNPDDTQHQLLPSRVHAIVLVSTIHKPTLRALAYARATRPSILEAVTVNVDPDETKALQLEWDRGDIPVPLKALDSPYREITRPVVDYVKSIRTDNPRDLIVVYIPQYVLGHWWEQLLHNQSALRLRARLLFTPGVMVSSVPVAARLRRRAPSSGWTGRSPARCAAATGERPRPDGLGPGDEVEVDVTADRARRALRRSPRGSGPLRPARASPGSGCGSASPRAGRATGSSVPTPSRSSSPRRTGSPRPCPYAGPGRCGGCDFQHVALAQAARPQGRGAPRAARPARPSRP